ncbi:DnaB-like helicase N-terminal domain-containing protein [Bacillus pinisoli]|uniref:DnaB-like helicase N-terminal domain-containing protein n=1 Tax=Bacillus pinisoli TaxID=2901866 RepID=UPI001FF5EB1B|nr:DnaB-like helicase N-terminal domain-containing protein [Bacillus pinisoli]
MNLPINQLFSVEAEASVIGAVLIDPEVVDDIVPKIEDRDFFNPANRHIWAGLLLSVFTGTINQLI